MKIKNRDKFLKNLTVVVLALFLFVYFFSLFLNSTKKSMYHTQIAVRTTVSDGIEAKGIAVREETPISGSKSQTVNYLVESGTKVSKNAAIAREYETTEDITAINKIGEIDREITALTGLQTKASSASSQDGISKPVYESVGVLNDLLNSGKLNHLQNRRQALSNSLNERDKKLNHETDFTAKLETLKQEKTQLQQGLSKEISTITAPESGYFINYTDGFEELVTQGNYGELTKEKIEELSEQQNISSGSTSIGKIIKDYRWKYVAIVPTKTAREYTVGGRAHLGFPTVLLDTIPSKILEVKVANDDESIVVFELDYLTAEIATIRNQPVNIGFYEYDGIRIDSSALRFNDAGEKGVYVLIPGHNEPQFRKIEVLFQTENYMLVQENLTDDEYLKLYDEVVIK